MMYTIPSSAATIIQNTLRDVQFVCIDTMHNTISPLFQGINLPVTANRVDPRRRRRRRRWLRRLPHRKRKPSIVTELSRPLLHRGRCDGGV